MNNAPRLLIQIDDQRVKLEIRDGQGGLLASRQSMSSKLLADPGVSMLRDKIGQGQQLSETEMVHLGQALGEFLFDDEKLRQRFKGLHDWCVQKEQILCVGFDLSQVRQAELANLSWELARLPDEMEADPPWLAAEPGLLVMRGKPSGTACPSAHLPIATLKIEVFICEPVGLGAIGQPVVGEALADIGKEFKGRVQVKLNPTGTASEIQRACLGRPNAIHFIGHGRQTEKGAELALVGADGNPEWVGAEALGVLFGSHPPQLVFLHLAHESHPAVYPAMVDLAQRLAEGHSGRAITAQYPINPQSAGLFVRRFYQNAYNKQGFIEGAVQQGRRQVWEAGQSRTGVGAFDFGAIVLLCGEGRRIGVKTEITPPVKRGETSQASLPRLENIETKKPPITASMHLLPFNSLPAETFERMCFWLVKRLGFEGVEHLGAAGSEQGRDITGWKAGELWAFQCKRVQSFSAGEAIEEIEKLLKLPEDQIPKHYVFMTSCRISAAAREEISEQYGQRLDLHFWAATELDEQVKRYPDILNEFFYPKLG